MDSRFTLINYGLYPETLPPCFVSKDAKRAFHGLVASLDQKKYNERRTEYIRYSGTKHDRNRRFFATPHIISYFNISSFIWRRWKDFEKNFHVSKFSIGAPKLLEPDDERAVKVPSLSELSKRASENIKYAPFVLKADIAQCFPSIYTHSIPWAKHGIDKSKKDTNKDSKVIFFNELDFFVRSGQSGHTRGVLVGPDGYRLIAEFVLCRLDEELNERVKEMVVGAVRHVDDYYIGLRTEHDAQSVLSHLREVLSKYELNINDQKTKIMSSLEPINDLWAQRLRQHTDLIDQNISHSKLEYAITEAIVCANAQGSDSPLKILLRSFDKARLYEGEHWPFIEQNLQRIVQKHPHAIDYACLLIVKRKLLGHEIDNEGWKDVAEIIISRSLALNHHHEMLWMLWLLIVCDVGVSPSVIDEVAKSRNGHVRALLIQASVDGKLRRKPKLALGSGLSSTDDNWLTNLVARSQGFSAARFSGNYAEEFEHLASRHIKLIDFDDHKTLLGVNDKNAISRSRYGYDEEEEEEEEEVNFDVPDFDDEDFPF